MPSLPPSTSTAASSSQPPPGLKRKRSKSRPWSSGSPSLPEASGSRAQPLAPAQGGESKKEERRLSMSGIAEGSGTSTGEVKREEEEVWVELGGDAEEDEGAPAQAGPSTKDKKGKGKARASPDKELSAQSTKPSRVKAERSMSQDQSASSLPPAFPAAAAPAPAATDGGASEALRERARRMKEIEDVARERAAKEAEVKDLKAREDRLGKEVAFKDTELEAQKDTLTKVKDSVTCGVCLELLWQPYILSPCGHTACFTCLKAWFLAPPPADAPLLPPRQRVKTCPTCRGEVEHLPTPVYVIKDLVHAIATKLTLDGGAEPVEPDPEGAEPWKGIFEKGEVRRRGMIDQEDGVERCVECGYEVLDGQCVNCGADYLEHDDSDGDFEADDLVGFIYGDGIDDGGAGPHFEFGDEDDEGAVDADLRSDFDDDDQLTDDGFLVGDDDVEESGSDSDEGSAFDGEDLDEETSREILESKGASEAMIDRFHLALRGHHILALLPQTLHPDTPFRLTIKNDIYLSPTDPYGARFLLTYLRGSRSGRAWLRREKAAREAASNAGGRRNARQRQREFSLGSFASDEGSEHEILDLDSEEELERARERRRARSGGVEPPSVGRRTVDISDSDEDEEEVEVRSRSSSVGGRRKRRAVVETSEEEEDDVEMNVGGRRNARASGSGARHQTITSLSSSPEPAPAPRLRSVRRSNTLPSNSPAPSSSLSSDPDASRSDSDAPTSDSDATKTGLSHLRRMYGSSARKPPTARRSRLDAFVDGSDEDDDVEVEVESDDDGLNMLGDGGRNDEGPDEPWYGEEDGFGEGDGEGGVMDDGEGDYY